MVVVQRRRRLSPLTVGLIARTAASVLAGMCIGYTLSKSPASPSDASFSSSSSFRSSMAVSSSSLTSLPPVALEGRNGFHPVYVYYGKEDAIKDLSSSSSAMKQNYGAGSQVDQDKIILALVRRYDSKRRNSDSNSNSNSKPRLFFIDLAIDLAANDAVQLSNTLRLEDEGWDGLCIEPNPIYWFRLAHHKCTIAAAFIGGSRDAQQVDVSLANKEYGGIIANGMDNTPTRNVHSRRHVKRPSKERRYTLSLRTLFRQFDVPPVVDYLSLDVEGAELLVMKDFPFDDHTIRFITIERPKPDLQALLKRHGYVFVMKLIFWGETLWVHRTILQHMDLHEMEDLVRNTSDWPNKKSGKKFFFDLESGEYAQNAHVQPRRTKNPG
ncbi:hypothetical protein ACHAWF_000655, partial [Thalassiosira exigua]